jgi:hypothetical protein
MRILTRNVIEENSSISMTNSDVSYPVANVYSNMLEEIAQSAGNNTDITINFSTDKTIDSIFFGYHNASSAIFVFKNSTGTTLDTIPFSFPNTNAKQYIDELTTVRSIEVSLVTTETNLYIGNIACGKYTEIYHVMLPITVEHMDSSLYSQTSAGQFLTRQGFILQSFAVECHKLTDEELAEFQAAFLYVHKGKTFWMDRTEDTEHQLFGAFDSNYLTTRIDELSELKFTFKEGK